MAKKNFFILAMMVVGIGMIIWTFFGGNPNSDDTNIPQDISTGFIQELTNTGEVIDTGLEIDDTNIMDTDYTEIKVMMPKYFYTSGWKNFAEDLYNNKKIYMKFIFIDDLNFYRNQLYDTNFSDADLFLFPYDRNEKISTRTFTPQQSLQPYFDDLLAPIISDTQISFMPFAADPMVMYSISGYNISTNNFYEISEFVLNRESIKPLSFPLFFGIDIADSYNKGFVWEYQDIVRYALIHYFQTNNDSHDLQTWVDSNALQKYNITDLNTILNMISNDECKAFPSLCFQIYNFVGIRFGFLSDNDIVNTYFTGKKANFEKLSKISVPFSQLESPIRIRGRGIRGSLDDAKTINAIYLLFKQYMDNHEEYPLRRSTLPVFKSSEGNELIDNKFIGLRGYVLQNGGDYINTLKGMTKFWELIEYQITAREYLK